MLVSRRGFEAGFALVFSLALASATRSGKGKGLMREFRLGSDRNRITAVGQQRRVTRGNRAEGLDKGVGRLKRVQVLNKNDGDITGHGCM